jgi:phenylalanyl-tRNA synthetase alpha chain
MALDRFTSALDAMLEQARALLSAVDSADGLEQLRVRFVGAKNGELKAVQKMLGDVSAADKPAAGKRFNETRDALQSAIDSATERLGRGGATKVAGPLIDPTLPGVRPRVGVVHPSRKRSSISRRSWDASVSRSPRDLKSKMSGTILWP